VLVSKMPEGVVSNIAVDRDTGSTRALIAADAVCKSVACWTG